MREGVATVTPRGPKNLPCRVCRRESFCRIRATSVGNLDRVKQNKVYEAKIADRTAREAALAELEKNGQRVKPEFGSVFYRDRVRRGQRSTARDDRVPARPPHRSEYRQQQDKALDHECGHVDRTS
jgi:hypothetical protein